MELHKLLSRQLARHGLSNDSLPADLEEWQNFLLRVHTTYQEAENDRYLNERSIEISSKEMHELNKKLENAQSIAGLGYWYYDRSKEKFVFSKGLYDILKLDPNRPLPTYEQIIKQFHEDDRDKVNECVSKAFKERRDFEIEARIKNIEKTYTWYYIVGRISRDIEKNMLSGIMMDITKRKAAEEEIATLHQQFITIAHHAGMADVASSILHNAGNVLNSAKVSVELIRENIKNSNAKKLFLTIEMLKNNLKDLAAYLTEDPKGKLIPEYLIAISARIQQEQNAFIKETENLSHAVQHLTEIVKKQDLISQASPLIERVYLPEIVDMALEMNLHEINRHNIKLHKNYVEHPFILTDKSSLLQILTNLLQNSTDAVVENENNGPKDIHIMVERTATGKGIQISVEDSGIGIKPENMPKIFTWGFTTKKKGHGYGLHHSALKAKEMGGALDVSTKGERKGSIFTITLPFNDRIT